MKKVRLDQLMVQRGLAPTRAKAQALIMSGVVRVGGQVRDKAGDMVAPEADVDIAEPMPYVSRGGYKLAHALDVFPVSPQNLVALDVGASTGGFTDVLLQRGAAHVYAVDVGYGLLDWRIRNDPRVTVLDRTNIRYLEALPDLGVRGQGSGEEEKRRRGEGETNVKSHTQHPTPHTPHPNLQSSTPDDGQPTKDSEPIQADCAVIDTAFISLKLVLPATQRLVKSGGWVVALIKPQFEAGPKQVGKGGVVRDRSVHASVIRDVLAFASQIQLWPHGLARSPITGPAGNVEFLAWLGGSGPALDVELAIEAVLESEKRKAKSE